MDLGFANRSVLVTAGTSGLGLAAAKSVAAEGANVTVCSRNVERLESAKAEIEEVAESEVHAVKGDITDPGDIADAVSHVVEETGRLDHLVASTGGVPPGSLATLTHEDWYGAFDLLVMSLVWTIDAAADHLAESDGGSITAIASTSVREPIDGLVLSNVVRRGVIGLVKSASRELAPDVRVNAVLPGPIETPRIEELLEEAVRSGTASNLADARSQWTADIPLGRIGEPSELGDLIAVLSSDRASYVTGACLPIDGGRLRS